MTIRKAALAAIVSGLLLAPAVPALAAKVQLQPDQFVQLQPEPDQFIGCCFTDKGRWCCSIGTATCECKAGGMASMPSLPEGVYSGDSLMEAIQQMMNALEADET